MEQIDVAVIGGGQSGLSVAHALRKKGGCTQWSWRRPGGRLVRGRTG
ncbi:hypothetical protein [Streptomyces chartreusis]